MFEFFATLKGLKLPPLSEILDGVSETKKDATAFDEALDKALEKRALEKLGEMRRGG